jgi:GR25 family glycosyltransferase involved in LPS biosynthesis
MDKISKIYIINLKERTDRWKDCLIQLNKYNIENYERFEAIRPDLKKIDPIQYSKNNLKMDEKYIIGALGCKLSHIEIIKNAKKNSYKQILILEDDFLLCENFIEKYNKIYSDIEKKKINIDILYLGFSIVRKEPFIDTSINNLKKVKSVHTTHAYIINYNFYDTILEELEKCHCEIDVCYANCQKKYNMYGIYPSLISQRTSFSDITHRNVDYSNFIKLDV